MSAERWSSSLAQLYAIGDPFLELLGSGSTAQSLQLQKPEDEQPVPQLEPDTKFEVLSTCPADEQPVPQLESDTEDSELEGYRGANQHELNVGEQVELEAEAPGESDEDDWGPWQGDQQQHQWSQEAIDKMFNDPEFIGVGHG